jgi:hypothetical protein
LGVGAAGGENEGTSGRVGINRLSVPPKLSPRKREVSIKSSIVGGGHKAMKLGFAGPKTGAARLVLPKPPVLLVVPPVIMRSISSAI